MKKTTALLAALAACATLAGGQGVYRSGIFLHHSTGGCIWGPNGSATSVPLQMAIYNAGHGYHGADSVRMNETWFPGSTDNEWSTWHQIFETDSPENVSHYFAANPIVMIKSCFPSSSITGEGQPSDTADPTAKTVCNYQWHWRHIVAVMAANRDNFFAIWTNAPLERNSTDSAEARLSDRFCRWAKDTLAAGLDTAFGDFPPNVYVFDFFHTLANGDGFLPDAYRSGAGDSHPNAAATALVAPQLVTELFDAAIAYESAYTGLAGGRQAPAGRVPLPLDNRPNPFSSGTVISYQLAVAGRVTVRIFDVAGREIKTVLDHDQPAGRHSVGWNGRTNSGAQSPSGVYIVKLQTGTSVFTKKIQLVK